MKKPIKDTRQLPKGWRWAKLGGKNGIADIINGSTPSTDVPEYWNGNILWATPTDLGNLDSIFISNTERKITKKGLENCSTKLLPVGTVLLTSRAPVGNLAIATTPICTNQGFKSFVPKKGIDNLYLYFALKSIIPEIQKKSHGNTFTEITKELISKFEIPMPPTKTEQKLISSNLNKKTQEIKKMRLALTKQLETIELLYCALLKENFNFEKEEK